MGAKRKQPYSISIKATADADKFEEPMLEISVIQRFATSEQQKEEQASIFGAGIEAVTKAMAELE